MLLILARHGNTFDTGEKTYRLGKRNDLPLVDKGKDQAQVFATALLDKHIIPTSVYCGPLQRTREFARIITEKLNLSTHSIIDDRLNELDYGAWAGLLDDEVKDKFGSELEGWEKGGVWPKNSLWPESEEEVVQQLKSFIKDLMQVHKADDVVLAVSSNGKLRYFLKLIESEFESRIKTGQVKVGTGKACVIACNDAAIDLVAWNISPAEL